MEHQIKKNDVFRFRYSPIEFGKFDSRTWCFEGYLIAHPDETKIHEFVYQDTHWGIKNTSNRILTYEEIQTEVSKGGSFAFYFNLDEVEEIQLYMERYYHSTDLFHLSRQHARTERCRYIYLRKGAQRNKQQMLDYLYYKFEEAQSKIRQVTNEIESIGEKINQVKGGNLSISI
jgi:hypothetical protein